MIRVRGVPTGVNGIGLKLAIRGVQVTATVMPKRPTRLAGKV
jgi:hypothetical protein